MKISKEVKKLLMQPENLGQLIMKFNKSFSTIRLWFDHDNHKITDSKERMAIVMEITGLKESEILEDEKV